MKTKAIGCRVVVQIKERKEFKESKIQLLESTRDRDQTARIEAFVVEIGPQADPCYVDGVNVGDRVLIAKYSGEDRKDKKSGNVYRVINDKDIIAVLEAEDGDEE